MFRLNSAVEHGEVPAEQHFLVPVDGQHRRLDELGALEGRIARQPHAAQAVDPSFVFALIDVHVWPENGNLFYVDFGRLAVDHEHVPLGETRHFQPLAANVCALVIRSRLGDLGVLMDTNTAIAGNSLQLVSVAHPQHVGLHGAGREIDGPLDFRGRVGGLRRLLDDGLPLRRRGGRVPSERRSPFRRRTSR